MCVILNGSQKMSFGGDSKAPCLYARLASLGLDESKTEEFSSKLMNTFESELGTPKNRTYIQFQSPERHMFGFDAKTFRK